MIRFILDHYVSRADINGNRYWLTRYTSTLTGRSLLVSTPHSSNSRALLPRDEPGQLAEYHETETEFPIRVWEHMRKRAAMVNACMDDAVRDAIAALEAENVL